MKNCPKCNIEHNKSGKFCSRKCANSRKWSDNDKLKKSNSALNSDKVKLANSNRHNNYIKKHIKYMDVICPVCNTQFRLRSLYYKNKRNCCSKRCKFKWMKDVGYLKGKSGGYREGAGRGKSGWYKGIFCNSTYELAWVIYNLENNIPFKRNDDAFEYTDSNGINRKYYPDFYLTDEKCYVEIKGYKEKEFENKQRAFPYKIILIDKHDIKKYINYVKEKYGNNFIELYEGNPHNNKLNKCEICGQQCKNKFCSRRCAGKNIGNKAYGYNQYDRKF